MKTILVLLFPIILIGCSNSLSDKKVNAMPDKAAKPPSQQKSEFARFGEELKAYSKQLEILSKHQDELAESFDRINKELDKHLAGPNWKINSTPWVNYDSTPNTNIDLGNIQLGYTEEPWTTPTKPIINIGIGLRPLDSLINQTITTGGSSIAIGHSAINGGTIGMSVDHLTGGNRNTPIGPNALKKTNTTDSIITIGYPNICIGDSTR